MTRTNALPPTLLAALDPETIPLPSRVLVLFGATSELHPLVLQSLLLRARRGERIGLIIGDNRLNAYALARLARAHGLDPASLLAQIEFSRSFTCHQLHHGIVDLVTEKMMHWHALYILGLLETFYDEDIRLPIASRLLNDILARLRVIASQGLSVLATIAPPPHETTRLEFVPRVLRSADAYWQPSPEAIEHAQRAAQQIGFW